MSIESSNPNSNMGEEEKAKLAQEAIDKEKQETKQEETKEEKQEEDKTEIKIEDKIEEDLLFIPEEIKVDLKKPEPTGNEDLDDIYNMLHEKEFDHTAIIKEIRDTNTLSTELQTELKSKFGNAGFDSLVKSFKKVLSATATANTAKVSTLMKLVAKEAYGEDSTEEQGTALFKEMQPWLVSNLKDDAKIEVNKALKAGGYTAEIVMKDLVKEFKMSSLFKDSINTQEASSTGTTEYKGISIKNHKDLHIQLVKAEAEGDTKQVKRIEEHFNANGYN